MSDTRQPTDREIFSFTASKEYVPTTPTSKTEAPICVVEGVAQELLLSLVRDPTCHDAIVRITTIAVFTKKFSIVK